MRPPHTPAGTVWKSCRRGQTCLLRFNRQRTPQTRDTGPGPLSVWTLASDSLLAAEVGTKDCAAGPVAQGGRGGRKVLGRKDCRAQAAASWLWAEAGRLARRKAGHSPVLRAGCVWAPREQATSPSHHRMGRTPLPRSLVQGRCKRTRKAWGAPAPVSPTTRLQRTPPPHWVQYFVSPGKPDKVRDTGALGQLGEDVDILPRFLYLEAVNIKPHEACRIPWVTPSVPKVLRTLRPRTMCQSSIFLWVDTDTTGQEQLGFVLPGALRDHRSRSDNAHLPKAAGTPRDQEGFRFIPDPAAGRTQLS